LGLIRIVSQGFFAARSYKVNKNIWLAGLMIALTVVTGVTGYVLFAASDDRD
jgi:hypothetical protein